MLYNMLEFSAIRLPASQLFTFNQQPIGCYGIQPKPNVLCDRHQNQTENACLATFGAKIKTECWSGSI